MYKINMIHEIAIREFENADPNALIMSQDHQIFWPIRLMESAQFARALTNALLVIVNDPDIRGFLEENDPKALEQCLDAIRAEKGEPWG